MTVQRARTPWTEFFPFDTPRPEQTQAIDEICAAFESGKTQIVCELGTGVGKSAIAVTLSRWLAHNFPTQVDNSPGGVVVTSQKTLQDQYTRDFASVSSDLRSASNYACLWSEDLTCGEVSRIANATTNGWPCTSASECDKRRECPYRLAKARYSSSHSGITNYSYFMSEATYAGVLKNRQLLICDECHRLEEELRKWATVQVDEVLAADLGIKLPRSSASDREIAVWMASTYSSALVAQLADMEQKLSSVKSSRGKVPHQLRSMVRKHEFFDKKLCQLNRWKNDVSEYSTEYVLVRTSGRDGRSYELKPLDVSNGAKGVLYSKAERILLMSATVLDFDAFMETVGVDRDSAVRISIPSPFDPKKFGVVYRPIGKMSKDSIDRVLPKIVEAIKRILGDHPDEKGIIHCTTYQIARAIADGINDSRLLVQKSGDDREGIITEHVTSSTPTVLVSPSMTEGLDLRDDLGRFQVMCKVPYPYLGDPVVKRLLERSQDWYTWRTALALVQTVGRCVRNEDDWTRTYILDECFGQFFLRSSHLFTPAFGAMEIDSQKQTR